MPGRRRAQHAPPREGARAVRVRGLSVAYRTVAGELDAVHGVDLDLPAGSITGLVGESGSGKSTLALSMLRAVHTPGRITAGSIEIDGLGDVLAMDDKEVRRARGAEIGYVFQAAQNSLNPLRRVGSQLLDLGRSHGVSERTALLRTARDLLDAMGLDAVRVLDSYEHELSGGMRQRVGIVFALVLNAHVVVLDEPTTALDMISQSTILKIIKATHHDRHLTTLVVTHDIGVVAEVADTIAVMYGGRLVEQGRTIDVLRDPRHPYTVALVGAMPRLSGELDAARPLPGRPPTLDSIPRQGCVFRERCAVYAALRLPACEEQQPPALPVPGAVGSDQGGDSAAPRAAPRVVACHAVAADRVPA